VILGAGSAWAKGVPLRLDVSLYNKTARTVSIEIEILDKGKAVYSFTCRNILFDTSASQITLNDSLYEVKCTYGFPSNQKTFSHVLKCRPGIEQVETIFYLYADSIDINLKRVQVNSYYPSQDKAVLVRNFEPSANIEPIYTLINTSNSVLYGYRSNNYFWGKLLKYNGSTWEDATEGSLCGNVGTLPPLLPGDTASAFIPDYFGFNRNRIPSKGLFRFQVLAADAATSFLFSYLPGPVLQDINIYRLTDEFEVK
jgi:hypothetical protein